MPLEEQKIKKRSKDKEKVRHESKRKHKDPSPDTEGMSWPSSSLETAI